MAHFKKILLLLALIATLFMPLSNILANAKKPVDTQAPNAPQLLTAVSVGTTSVSLNWRASTDNKKISSYLIFQNSIQIASTTSLSFTVKNLTPDTTYLFYVKAKDTSGNLSAASNVLSVKTAPQPATPSDTPSSYSNSSSVSSSASSEPSSSSSETSSSSSTSSSPGTLAEPPAVSKISAGYYASWAAYSGYTPLHIAANKLTHINYAFANIGSDLKIAIGDPEVDLSNFAKLNQLKTSYPHLKTLISVGGWEWSGKFSDAALTDYSRTVFADSVVAFIKQYGFDGVDLDWEYPVGGGKPTNITRPEDKTNFTLLLQKIREKLNAQGSIDGKKYLLSIAGGAGSFYVNNTELNQIHTYLDYAVIMTYDIHGPWDNYTDLNAPLYTPSEPSPLFKWSVDASVKAWIGKGFPASKIVVGIPFYGYVYSGVPNLNNGLYNSYVSGISMAYDKIKANYLSNTSFTKFYHSEAKVPWLFNGSVFITYDNEQSIAEKARYITANHLAGASVWELSQNTDGTLLSIIYSNLK